MSISTYEIYEKLEGLRKRFANAECVSFFVFEDSVRVRIDWKDCNYTEFIPKDMIQVSKQFQNYDDVLFNKIENKYKVWEVGEE